MYSVMEYASLAWSSNFTKRHYQNLQTIQNKATKIIPAFAVQNKAPKIIPDFTECSEGRFIHDGLCISQCPDKYYEWNSKAQGTTGSPRCQPCHYSCFKCSGPQDNECTKCRGDATLYKSSK
ncbi:hypothetical protein SK128_020597, partial [Halocaridina rubra]